MRKPPPKPKPDEYPIPSPEDDGVEKAAAEFEAGEKKDEVPKPKNNPSSIKIHTTIPTSVSMEKIQKRHKKRKKPVDAKGKENEKTSDGDRPGRADPTNAGLQGGHTSGEQSRFFPVDWFTKR